jgi:phage replication-related protein YjqB (UPF0714/DUF867 family)
MLKDKYLNLSHLKCCERRGEDYLIRSKHTDSNVLIISPHGGAIEEFTSNIASQISEATENPFMHFDFQGIKPEGNLDLHVTSTWYDDHHLKLMLGSAHVVCAIHGCRGEHEGILLGGLDTELKERVTSALSQSFPAIHDPPTHLRGISEKNICNQGCTGKGLQIELTFGFRQRLHVDDDAMDLFCKTVSSVLWNYSQESLASLKYPPVDAPTGKRYSTA